MSRAIKLGFMGFDLNEHKATIFNQGDGRWSTSTLSTIGLAVKNAMLVPEKTANKYVYIDSFTVSQNQVLAALQKVTSSNWETEHVDGEEQKKAGIEKMSKGDFSGAMALIRFINCVEGHGGNYADYQDSANADLSLPKVTLEEILENIVRS